MTLILQKTYPLNKSYIGDATYEKIEYKIFKADILVSDNTLAGYIDSILVEKLMAKGRGLLLVKVYVEDINWAEDRWVVEAWYTGNPIEELSPSLEPATLSLLGIVFWTVIAIGAVIVAYFIYKLVTSIFVGTPGQLGGLPPFVLDIVSIGVTALLIGGGALLLAKSGILDKFTSKKAIGG